MNQFAAIIGKRRSVRRAQPFDQFSKAQLWAKCQELTERCNRAASAAETVARDAHNHAADVTGSDKIRFYQLRDNAHLVTAIARGEKP